jgi:streptomycin 6-kinase
MFEEDLARWGAVPDGEPIVTHGSRLLAVRCGDLPAMIKQPVNADEKLGCLLMQHWTGEGAAMVLAQHGDTLLLERATGPASLAAMSRQGQDDEACRILCEAASRLHAPRGRPLPDGLLPLETWFEPLTRGGDRYGGVVARAAAIACELLAERREIVTLHGDLHHDNVLDFGPRGWLAIDPRHLVGDRGYDFGSIFTNPDMSLPGAPGLADPGEAGATQPGRLARRAPVVAEAAGMDRARLLRWVLAAASLSAVWSLDDGDEGEHPAIDLAVAEVALAELG